MKILAGLLIVFLAGTLAGIVLLPTKFMRKYRFENYWLIYGVVGAVIIPWCLAFGSVPHLLHVYSEMPWKVLLLPPIFGLSWGLAAMLTGLCASRIGLSLTYALVVGVGASVGSLVPLLCFSIETFRTTAGAFLLAGVAVMFGGLILIALAGRKRERQSKQKDAHASRRDGTVSLSPARYLLWLITAVLAGSIGAGLNFSFVFGQPIAVAAQSAGASANHATYAVWALAMLGGMLPNVVYPLVLCVRNNSWNLFLASPGLDLPLSITMGCLLIGSVTVYGVGAIFLGPLGTSVGWGIMQILQIVSGNVSGFLTGEWQGADSSVLRLVLIGLAILTIASVLMAIGNYVHAG
jgi:L-rhamnose-H+ transport protein